jgi:hypothetical protein
MYKANLVEFEEVLLQQLLKNWKHALIIEPVYGIWCAYAWLYGFRISTKPSFLR